MLKIDVPAASPKVELTDEFKQEAVLFTFDKERYLGGLTLAGVPAPAAETLLLEFDTSRYYDQIDYFDQEHKVGVKLGTQGSHNANGSIGWTNVSKTKATVVNYGLARTANVIAEAALGNQDIVTVKRYREKPSTIRGFVTGAALFAGSIAGAGLAEANGGKPALAGVLGGVAAGGIDILSLALLETRGDVKRRKSAVKSAVARVNERSTAFAETPEALKIFNGIVDVRFR